MFTTLRRATKWYRTPCLFLLGHPWAPNTLSTTVSHPENDQRCQGHATSVGGRKLSVTPSQILGTLPVLVVLGHPLDASSAAYRRKEAQVKGMIWLLAVTHRKIKTDSLDRYIKELADRIHSIENKLESDGGLSQDDIDRLFSTDRPRQSQGEDAARKRPFSSISTNDFVTPSRQMPWGSDHRMQASPGTSEAYSAYNNNNSLAPQATPIRPDSTPSKPPVAAMDVSMPDAHETVDIDESMLQRLVIRRRTPFLQLTCRYSVICQLLALCIRYCQAQRVECRRYSRSARHPSRMHLPMLFPLS